MSKQTYPKRKVIVTQVKLCKTCGEKFMGSRAQKFCSLECHREFYDERDLDKLREKIENAKEVKVYFVNVLFDEVKDSPWIIKDKNGDPMIDFSQGTFTIPMKRGRGRPRPQYEFDNAIVPANAVICKNCHFFFESNGRAFCSEECRLEYYFERHRKRIERKRHQQDVRRGWKRYERSRDNEWN